MERVQMNTRISNLVADHELRNSKVIFVYHRVIADIAHRGVAEMSVNEYNTAWCVWETDSLDNRKYTFRRWYSPKEYINQRLATIGYRVRVTGGKRSGYRLTLAKVMG